MKEEEKRYSELPEFVDDVLCWLVGADARQLRTRVGSLGRVFAMAGREGANLGAYWELSLTESSREWESFPREIAMVLPFVPQSGAAESPMGPYMFVMCRPLRKAERIPPGCARHRYMVEAKAFGIGKSGAVYRPLSSISWFAGASAGWILEWPEASEEFDDVLRSMVSLAAASVSLHSAMPKWWMVHFGYEGTPLVSVRTDSVGAREAFALRDIPNGAKRRAALRHWVREHSRQNRHSSEEATVRAHLRGQSDFTWNGLHCVIEPSAIPPEPLIREEAALRSGLPRTPHA